MTNVPTQYVQALVAPSRVRNRTASRGVGTSTAIVRSQYPTNISLTSGSGALFASCGPEDGLCTATATQVAASYEFYRIRSLQVEIIPVGGANSTGVATMAFVDNPELMVNGVASTSAARNIIINAQNAKTCALGFPCSLVYSPQRRSSRPYYSVNLSGALGSTPEVADRSVQACFGILISNAGSATSWTIMTTAVYEFSGLGSSGSYTLYRSLTDEGYPIVPVYADYDSWPPRITAKNGALGLQDYVLATEQENEPAQEGEQRHG